MLSNKRKILCCALYRELPHLFARFQCLPSCLVALMAKGTLHMKLRQELLRGIIMDYPLWPSIITRALNSGREGF